MIGDHNYPAVFLFSFDVVENIYSAFARQIDVEHGHMWIQLIYENRCFIVAACRMKVCRIKILREDRDYPLNVANIIVNDQDQMFQCELIV